MITKILIQVLLLLFAFVECSKPGNNETFSLLPLVSASMPPQNDSADFPQPALNSAKMRLGNANFNRTIDSCPSTATTLGNPFDLPTLFITNVDLSLNAGVSLSEAGAFRLIIDPDGQSFYSPSIPCPADIIENSSNAYDILVLNCTLKKNAVTSPAPPTNIVSFRARCSKN